MRQHDAIANIGIELGRRAPERYPERHSARGARTALWLE